MFDAQEVTSMLAIAILVVLVPTFFLSRSVSRHKVSRMARERARELGLEFRGPVGSRRDPLFRGLAVIGRRGRQAVTDVCRGDYRGHPLLMADVRERPLIASAIAPGSSGPVGTAIRLVAVLMGVGFLASALLHATGLLVGRLPYGGAMMLGLAATSGLIGLVFTMPFLAEAARRRRSAANHLLVIFIEPVPGLPEFLLDPRSADHPDLDPEFRFAPTRPDDSLPPPLAAEYASLGAPLDALPPAFLDRATQVLVGRSTPWSVQGTGGRLAIWISNWHAPTTLRPVRSYRSVLDDAVSLREALDPSTAPVEPSGAIPPRKSIRSALELIHGEPGPNHRGRTGV
ncbi:hypothetical protein [Tautonia plasticadhaerens]|uniref:Uncharacterized protein n=1 Tax=Tautonia plasticadhaerens TaxID=2527974 RepID=A0A518H5K4_9BACT|nr:hypothetical protein [Tautonia plasticadhaerens]QDV36123.1 hypothetical protein ElP_40370 [Tautonia plasticadhaerens]